jgi:hypothetical protein
MKVYMKLVMIMELVNFATSKKLRVKSTMFPHRNIHKFTLLYMLNFVICWLLFIVCWCTFKEIIVSWKDQAFDIECTAMYIVTPVSLMFLELSWNQWGRLWMSVKVQESKQDKQVML